MDLHGFRQAEFTADTVLLQDVERSDPLIIEFLTRPLGLNVLC